MDRAACVGKDLNDFFSDNKDDIKEAKEFCNNHCKARMECLIWAMKNEAPKKLVASDGNRAVRHGVYGGLDARERTKLYKTMQNIRMEGN